MKTQLLLKSILFFALWAVKSNAFVSLSTCNVSVIPTEMLTHTPNIVSFTHATHLVSEVTTSVVASEFLVFKWVVLPYLAKPIDLSPMKVDLGLGCQDDPHCY